MRNPMKELKSEFDALALLAGSHAQENLNKSAPKVYVEQLVPNYFFTNQEGETFRHVDKGVASDFIKLLRFKLEGSRRFSLGFAFDYMSDFRDPTMRVSAKMGVSGSKESDFFVSRILPLEEGKAMFKMMNKELSALRAQGVEPGGQAVFEAAVNCFGLVSEQAARREYKGRSPRRA